MRHTKSRSARRRKPHMLLLLLAVPTICRTPGDTRAKTRRSAHHPRNPTYSLHFIHSYHTHIPYKFIPYAHNKVHIYIYTTRARRAHTAQTYTHTHTHPHNTNNIIYTNTHIHNNNIYIYEYAHINYSYTLACKCAYIHIAIYNYTSHKNNCRAKWSRAWLSSTARAIFSGSCFRDDYM